MLKFWPVGDFHDNTTRVLGGCLEGYEKAAEAQAVIDDILKHQSKPHHVTYRVESAVSISELKATGVLV